MSKAAVVQVEVVRELPEASEIVSRVIAYVIANVGITSLLAWWFFASWFPELGITWWSLVLPVWTIRFLFAGNPIKFWRDKRNGDVIRTFDPRPGSGGLVVNR